MKKWLLVVLMLLSTQVCAAIKENVDYKVLAQPQPVADPKKIEVLEFFSYNCIHCKDLEPRVLAWQKTQPRDVDFKQQQIVWGESMEGFARLFATVTALNLGSKLNEPIFQAIFQKNTDLRQPDVLKTWLPTQGVNAATFLQTFQSFGVNAAVARAKTMTRDYKIEATPTFVIGGKYLLMPATPDRLLQVVDELVQQIRAKRK